VRIEKLKEALGKIHGRALDDAGRLAGAGVHRYSPVGCSERYEEPEEDATYRKRIERALLASSPAQLLQLETMLGVAAEPAAVTEEKHDHPAHYGGKDNPYEAIKVIEAWGATFCGGNALKYIARAGKKSGESTLDDLKKAKWYLVRAASHLGNGTRRVDLQHAPPGAPSYDSDDVAEAWGLPEALARCIAAIAIGHSMVALNHLNDHIINIMEKKA
jgi:hypothetical protein